MKKWQGIIGFEEQLTSASDRRIISRNALVWDASVEEPLPLRWSPEDIGAHQGARNVGNIQRIWREGAGEIWGEGEIDDDGDGYSIVRQIQLKTAGSVSLDLDDIEGTFDPDTEISTFMKARIRGLTIVSISAFIGAKISILEDEGSDDDSNLIAIIASAIPVAPPEAWFSDPELGEATRITVTPDGRVFGHIAQWGTCHTGYAAKCVEPPSSPSSYAYFRTGAVETAEGNVVPTGRLTIDTNHASLRASGSDAISHYDHTGAAVADVVVGEDAIGIWFSGALRPGVTAEQVRVLRASSLSGDWRPFSGHLEMVGALAVNTPGFPIPGKFTSSKQPVQARFREVSGEVLALTSAGLLRGGKKTATQLDRTSQLALRSRRAAVSVAIAKYR